MNENKQNLASNEANKQNEPASGGQNNTNNNKEPFIPHRVEGNEANQPKGQRQSGPGPRQPDHYQQQGPRQEGSGNNSQNRPPNEPPRSGAGEVSAEAESSSSGFIPGASSRGLARQNKNQNQRFQKPRLQAANHFKNRNGQRPFRPIPNVSAPQPTPNESMNQSVATNSLPKTDNFLEKVKSFNPFGGKRPKDQNQKVMRFIPLGGNGQVTKNLFVYEYGEDIVIVDCGMGFPDDTMPGVDYIIPDISYLRDKKKKIRGVIITHGHEDHIGAIQHIVPELGCPVFATRLTAALINNKLKEYGLVGKIKINIIEANADFQLGGFKIEHFQVSHSIPDSGGYAITCGAGTFVHTGDFKMDWTPVDGKTTNVGKLAMIGSRGVTALMSDCVRSEVSGYTRSEKDIQKTFEDVMETTPGKVLITTFSSNVSRVQQALWAAEKFGRKVAVVGRSMENNMMVARDLNYVDIPKGIIVRSNQINRIPNNKLTLIISGAMGQTESALTRAANNEHRFVTLKKGDAAIFSSDPIPGSFDRVFDLIDKLSKLDVKVHYSTVTSNLHVSGHASSHELMIMMSLVNPKFYVPVSGDYRQMVEYARIASERGANASNTFLLAEGDVLEFSDGKATPNGHIETSNIIVDGLGVGDVGSVVLKDRRTLAEEGILVVIVTIDKQKGQLIGEPDVVSRGFVYMKEAGQIIYKSKEKVKQILSGDIRNKDKHYLREKISVELERYLYESIERRPMVLPVIIES